MADKAGVRLPGIAGETEQHGRGDGRHFRPGQARPEFEREEGNERERGCYEETCHPSSPLMLLERAAASHAPAPRSSAGAAQSGQRIGSAVGL